VNQGTRQTTYRLPTDVLDDIIRVVDVDPVKVDAWERARVCDAVEDRCHAATGPAPVRPKIDDGDAVRVDLCSGGEMRRSRKSKRAPCGCPRARCICPRSTTAEKRCELTTLLNCASDVNGTTDMIIRHLNERGPLLDEEGAKMGADGGQ
jgi:hypothetical protein